MNMATKVLAVYIVSLVGFFASVAENYAATRAAASCSLSDIETAIASASVNDILTVPAGNCTWSGTLLINKGISLVGAGIDKTVISGNNRGEGNYLITYAPTANSQEFRLTGFTFNVTNQNGLQLRTNSEPTTQTNVRIHHNRFTNSNIAGGAIYNWGMFGVIDNNTFDAMRYPLRVGQAMNTVGSGPWTHYADDFHGTANNMWVEDNTFANVTTTLTDCDQGGRYGFRYNTIGLGSNMYPLFDTHEWGTSGYACMGAVIYGNLVTGGGGFFMSSQAAGRNILHHNQMNGGVINIYSDGGGGCPPSNPANFAARQWMNNYYMFRNRETATGTLMETVHSTGPVCSGLVVENSTYWDDEPAAAFTSASGVGSGTLASRPATCTTGVGYWETDQSITDLTGMVGKSHSLTITGTLYKCTNTNNWTVWYTPFTYPHPLRILSFADDPQGPPSVPQDLRIN